MTYITAAHMNALHSHPHWKEFQAYHAANPDTLDWFIEMALRAVDQKGYDHLSIEHLLQIGRWESGKDFSMGSKFRDYFRAIYARLVMVYEPRLDGMFELRVFAHERGERVPA